MERALLYSWVRKEEGEEQEEEEERKEEGGKERRKKGRENLGQLIEKKKKRPGPDCTAQNSHNGPKGLNWRTRLPSLMLTYRFNRRASCNFPCMEPGLRT